jgi:hypothetical protein
MRPATHPGRADLVHFRRSRSSSHQCNCPRPLGRRGTSGTPPRVEAPLEEADEFLADPVNRGVVRDAGVAKAVPVLDVVQAHSKARIDLLQLDDEGLREPVARLERRGRPRVHLLKPCAIGRAGRSLSACRRLRSRHGRRHRGPPLLDDRAEDCQQPVLLAGNPGGAARPVTARLSFAAIHQICPDARWPTQKVRSGDPRYVELRTRCHPLTDASASDARDDRRCRVDAGINRQAVKGSLMSLQLLLASSASVEVTSAAEEAGSGRTVRRRSASGRCQHGARCARPGPRQPPSHARRTDCGARVAGSGPDGRGREPAAPSRFVRRCRHGQGQGAGRSPPWQSVSSAPQWAQWPRPVLGASLGASHEHRDRPPQCDQALPHRGRRRTRSP